MLDYYQILGVAVDAAPHTISERYRFLAQAYHPDKFASEAHKAKAEQEFKQISQAYAVLSDSGSRADFDRKRVAQDPESAPASSPNSQNRDNNDPKTPRMSRRLVGAVVVIILAFVLAAPSLYRKFRPIAPAASERQAPPSAYDPSVESAVKSRLLISSSQHLTAEHPQLPVVRTFK
jgi:curved DNA-binding protein CbpA